MVFQVYCTESCFISLAFILPFQYESAYAFSSLKSVECGVWSVECGVWSVECGVWSVLSVFSIFRLIRQALSPESGVVVLECTAETEYS